MPQEKITRIRGLWTNPNDASMAPEGSLAVADDVSLARPGIAEPRRGMLSKGAAGGAINAVTEYGGQLVAHIGSNTVKRSADDGTTWTAYSGTYSPPDANTPVTFTQQDGSLFMNTAAGEYELDSVTGTWRLTGAPRGLDGTAALQRTSSTSGWASPDGQWAYRDVWGYKNANGFVEYGAPSGRYLFTNPATFSGSTAQVGKAAGGKVVTVTGPTHGLTSNEYIDVTLGGVETNFASGTFKVTVTSPTIFTYDDGINNGGGVTVNPAAAITYGMTRNVSHNIPIPSGMTTSNFVQLYRSGKSASDSDEPSDILGQVAEIVPTDVDIANGYISWTDMTPDALRGAQIYTSEQGMLYSKERPPLSKCKAVWRGCTFYCATTGVQSLTVQLLSTSYLYTGANATILAFGNACGVSPHTSTEDATYFKLTTSGSPAQNIADTARSIVRSINLGTATHHVRAWYTSGDTDPPGLITVERDASYGQFEFSVQDGGAVEFAPVPLNDWGAAAGGVVRAANVVTVTTVQPHDFVVGQRVTLEGAGTADFPAGVKTVASVPTSTSFTYAETGAGATSADAIYFMRSGPTVLSGSAEIANRIMWSMPGEPWAVPLAQYADVTNPVGGPTPNIKAVTPIRDKVVIWTDAGAYQITGTYPYFSLSELDVTVDILAPRTAKAFGGYAVAWTTQGVTVVSESARIVDVPIADRLKSLAANYKANVALRAFAVAYEAEHAYILFVPANGSDAYASQEYVLWTGSGEENWSRWTLAATAGFIRPSDGRLYIGTSGTMRQERKAFATSDYADGATTAVNSVVEWECIQPVGPGAEALVHTGSFDFKDANFTSGTYQVYTNLQPTLSTAYPITVPGGPAAAGRELVFAVPNEYERGTRFHVRLNLSMLNEHFELQGVTLNYTKESDQPGR